MTGQLITKVRIELFTVLSFYRNDKKLGRYRGGDAYGTKFEGCGDINIYAVSSFPASQELE